MPRTAASKLQAPPLTAALYLNTANVWMHAKAAGITTLSGLADRALLSRSTVHEAMHDKATSIKVVGAISDCLGVHPLIVSEWRRPVMVAAMAGAKKAGVAA